MKSVYRDWVKDWVLASRKRESSSEELREALSCWLDKVLKTPKLEPEARFWVLYWVSRSPWGREVLKGMYGDGAIPVHIAESCDAVTFSTWLNFSA